jgi:hypothetical protein
MEVSGSAPWGGSAPRCCFSTRPSCLLGWRFGFAIGGALGLGILLLRRIVPERRWLVTHGWKQQADAAMSDIEGRVRSDTGADLAPTRDCLEVYPRKSFGLGLVLGAMLQKYRERSLLALVLLTAQAFLFNAVFFSYGLVLTNFHGVREHTTGLYLVPLAASNFLGPSCWRRCSTASAAAR